MESGFKLFMVMLGATPEGRLTEQHDIFFGIGKSLKELVPKMEESWPEAKGIIHIDAWREVTSVDGFEVIVSPKTDSVSGNHLFFLNLGGYRDGEFEEYHYKVLTVSETMAAAIKTSKATTFYKHCGFKGAESHIDDKYGIDVDDVFKVIDILPASDKQSFSIEFHHKTGILPDELHIGYVKIASLLK
ncbi:DUF1543 domain-containing protein [Flavobacterium silvaticum]|uniref:DUF1543 domain-containing protein n=1 Tax=Flavobacterium silvaticum TaxID=1852020 RepID=A0A972FL93_9FLAO|nr:DUF1543 domain-containing protein [Flavobacterium silvaticum]NMH27798.1 DUF1543 domain-containing protein [Flavobacterium silvaticum]